MAQETDLGVRQIDAGGGLEELDYGGVAVDLQHFAPADGAVMQFDLHQFVVSDVFNHTDHHQRAVDLLYGFVFTNH